MTLSPSLLTRSLLLLALLAATVHPAAAQTTDAVEARVAAALTEAHGEAVPAGLARAVAGTLSQEQRLTASDGAVNDQFGYSVAIDGDRALVGARQDDNPNCSLPGSNQCGAAYVFVFDGSEWVEQQKLTGSMGAGDGFGYSVAIDGDHALVGAPFEAADDGAAYVFAFDGSQWVEQQRLSASARGEFGRSVALDGDRALVGAPEAPLFQRRGAAYVFAFDGSQPPGQEWTVEQTLVNPISNADINFGSSVALDGDRALIGVPAESTGTAFVFAFDGSEWVEQQRLSASDGTPSAGFGWSVALQGDRALVGSPSGNCADGSPNCGAAYVFAFNAGTGLWSEAQKLNGSNEASGYQFGWSVALSGDRALVGAFNEEPPTGAAYAYAFDGSQPPGQRWTEDQKLKAGDAGDASFGWSVALDGDRALVGTFSGVCAEGTGLCGTAYVFGPAPPLDLSARNTTSRNVAPGESVGFAYTLDNNTAAPASGQLWYAARTSGGATVAQAVILSGTLPAGASQSGTYTQFVPGNAPAGAYTYCLRLGVFPNTVVDEACFILTVTGTARPSDSAVWSVRDVTPWENALTEDAPEASSEAMPEAFALEAAYPNPFAARAVIGYAVPEAARVTLTVYDVLGRAVATLVDGEVEAGRHTAVLDGRGLPSGSYLVRLDAGGAVQTQQITLVR